MSELPQAESADPDAVQMALQAAQTLWSRGETAESLRWLKRAAESASDEGADLRSLQLAKAAAELRAKLFGGSSDASASVPVSVRPRDELGMPVRSEDSAPASGRPEGTQYVVHRPRESQRQLMGLSSTTLETAVQRNGSRPSSVPSWSAGAETRRSSSPPPLPHTSLDDYEELEAEPDEETDSSEAEWAVPSTSAWRPLGGPPEGSEAKSRRREAGSDSSPRVATLPPPGFASAVGSSPPPLPDASSFSEGPAFSAFSEDEAGAMRAEQATRFHPSKGENEAPLGVAGRNFPSADEGPPVWDVEARLARWDSSDSGTGTEAGWGAEARSSGWGVAPSGALGSFDAQNTASESAPAKLTARVHHQAVRVSFAPDARGPGQYVVRVLREGEKAREGERIALLVALEPGVPLV